MLIAVLSSVDRRVYCLHETVLGMCHICKYACRSISASGAGKGYGVVELVTTRSPKDAIKTKENHFPRMLLYCVLFRD
jgi:hypothetical protein